MKYLSYKYIYPPRPENKISPTSLSLFDNGNYLAQPKLNGSCMQVYTDGKNVITMNRHKTKINHKLDINELRNLHRGTGWMVLCGEYMNKSQMDECNKQWNHKFVIFDIIVYENTHLISTTFEERFNLLEKLYPNNSSKKYLHLISDNCFRVSAIKKGLKQFFDDIVKYQMYEGLVLKLTTGKLENGISERNNIKTQIKSRKNTKNYAF